MATSKKPRKKSGTFSHKQRTSRLDFFSSCSFALHILRLGEHSIMNILNGRVPQTKTEMRAYVEIMSVPRKWSITYGCICRNQVGDEWITHNYARLQGLHRFEDLDADIELYLSQAIDEVNHNHILSPYYIASPEGREFTEEQVFHYIHVNKNAFERLHTLYECNEAKRKGIEELKGIEIAPYLPKTDKGLPKVLSEHQLHTFFDARSQDRAGLLALKGISEKRMPHIETAFTKMLTERAEDCSQYIKFVKILDQMETANQFIAKFGGQPK